MKAVKRDIAIWKNLPRTRKLIIFLAIVVLFFTGFLAGIYVFSF